MNPRDLLYRSLDPAEAAALAARHLAEHEDGELYLQHKITESFGFDDGRLKTADFHTASGFGLRADPFTGETRFHRGLDLALAYGSEVRAAAPGVVVSAGDRAGYGLTVVVDHGGGRETLYAHLSAVDVAPGDRVDAGQRIARSGRSGRATGAHLHVEARQDGRPVDVGRLPALWAGRPDDTSVGGSDE